MSSWLSAGTPREFIKQALLPACCYIINESFLCTRVGWNAALPVGGPLLRVLKHYYYFSNLSLAVLQGKWTWPACAIGIAANHLGSGGARQALPHNGWTAAVGRNPCLFACLRKTSMLIVLLQGLNVRFKQAPSGARWGTA